VPYQLLSCQFLTFLTGTKFAGHSKFFRPGLKYINRFEFRDFSAANEVE
jgi:hypothetical protein